MPHIQFAINIAFTDYYPFGSPMPGRNSNSADYRFGFNGQEMDNEISGQTGTHTTAMFWEYDSRLGRRWNRDPIIKCWQGSYACFSDNPIIFVDPLGDTDFFDLNGIKIGTDGIDNGIRLLILEKSTAKSIKKQMAKTGKAVLSKGQMKYAAIIPDESMLQKMDYALFATEESGVDENGFIMTPWWSSTVTKGKFKDDGTQPSWDITSALREFYLTGERNTDYIVVIHTHPCSIYYDKKSNAWILGGNGPSGTDEDADGNYDTDDMGSSTACNYLCYVIQLTSNSGAYNPSFADKDAAESNPNTWIRRTDETTVHIYMYNSHGYVWRMEYDKFRTIVNKVNSSYYYDYDPDWNPKDKA